MQDPDFDRLSETTSRRSGPLKDTIAGAAADAYEKTSDFTGQAAERARQAAADAASSMSGQVKGLLDRQVEAGASMVGDFARSLHVAADDLHENAPQMAGLMRGVAERVSDYAEELEDCTADDVIRVASDLTRRQPALVFGLAALAGFLAFRTFRSAPTSTSMHSPSIQPSQSGHAGD